MGIFNRVAVLIISLAILAGAVITLLVATELSTPDIIGSGWLESQLQRAADATGGSAAAIIAVCVIVALGMIALLVFELSPYRKPVPLLISSSEKGIATIDKESVCVLAEAIAASSQYVRYVECSVKERTGGLLVTCRASVALGCNVPELSAELQSNIKQSVEQMTGLPVVQVDVKTKYESVEGKRLALR